MRRADAAANRLSMPGNAQRTVSDARWLEHWAANARRSSVAKSALDTRELFTRGEGDVRRVPAPIAGAARAARGSDRL